MMSASMTGCDWVEIHVLRYLLYLRLAVLTMRYFCVGLLGDSGCVI
jgi:hypothetical protein